MKINDIINNTYDKEIINKIIGDLHYNGPTSIEQFETLSYIKKFDYKTFSNYENRLMYLLGLFYKTNHPKNLIEFVYSTFSDEIVEKYGKPFTPIQRSALDSIDEYRYFSFSAPTSTGKSYLFREIVKSAKNDIVITVPSRALIAEYTIKLNEVLGDDVLVLQFIDNININKTKRRVFIITPERGKELFKYKTEFNVDLFIFDEAQLSEDETRGLSFDAFVRRVDQEYPTSKKVFAHPFIENPQAQLLKHNFNKNANSINYKQNSVGKIFIAHLENKFEYFSPFDDRKKKEFIDVGHDIIHQIIKDGGSILIYESKASIYQSRFLYEVESYLNLCKPIVNEQALNIIEKLRIYIGASKSNNKKHSILIDLMLNGIVIHHGSMPLKARLLIEEFINLGFARICLATATLAQGINMPFDLVWLRNFKFEGNHNKKLLDLKNLIGRAGRSTNRRSNFDYGYVVLEKRNVDKFCDRLRDDILIDNVSQLEKDLDTNDVDFIDEIEAVKNSSFDDEKHITISQLERLKNSNIFEDIELILRYLICDRKVITGNDYYNIPDTIRKKIKLSFQNIYKAHLRREELETNEISILSASIPIILWRIQGKSFAEIISLRYSFLTNRSMQQEIRRNFKSKLITKEEYDYQISNIKIKYSIVPSQLPNRKAPKLALFNTQLSIEEIDYDLLVYDTYDYIDKVIEQSLVDPLCAAFALYYDIKKDENALDMQKYLRYGTKDEVEIWLLRYGFGFDDIEWIKEYVESIDEYGIQFSSRALELAMANDEKIKLINKYL